jgi:hypothetical protein
MATSTQAAAVLDTSTCDFRTCSHRRWTSLKTALTFTVVLRIFYSLAGAWFVPYLQLDAHRIRSNSLTEHLMSRDAHPMLYGLLGVWERFDTLWYVEIARHGYFNAKATVFYPLFPALMRLLTLFTRSELASALLISTTATFLLFWGALRLFELDYSRQVSFRAILLWVVWPSSFAFFAGYPDSMLCALVIWSIYLARRERWMPAGVFGLLAGLTKALGCFVALPLFWLAWKQRKKEGALAAAVCGAGVICFQATLAAYHFPSAAQVYRTYWRTTTVAPWTSLLDAARVMAHGFDLPLFLNLSLFALIGWAALRPGVRTEYKLFVLAAMVLFLAKHTQPLLQSTMRYSLTIFAAYPVMALKVNRPFWLGAVLLVGGALNLLLFKTFLDWGLVI